MQFCFKIAGRPMVAPTGCCGGFLIDRYCFDKLKTQAVRNSLRYMVIMALEYILVNVLHM